MSYYLVLENGEIIKGDNFGKQLDNDNNNFNDFVNNNYKNNNNIEGEVVFQTGMVGYPEALTDPSYKNQIIVLTYPIIGNYGIPNMEEKDEWGLTKYFESNKIHVSAVIIGEYVAKHSHWKSIKSLGEWLKENNIVGLCNVDTRHLTKMIRSNGVMKGQIVFMTNNDYNDKLEWSKLNDNLAPLVTTSITDGNVLNPSGKTKVLVIDCGVKNSQLRLLLKHDCSVKIVPMYYDFTKYDNYKFDRLFLSNGPGDPSLYTKLVERLHDFMEIQSHLQYDNIVPIFGVCLGNQILGLATGGKTYKMIYGNRGHNIPVQLVGSKKCFITSQNHGYALDVNSLGENWEPLFVNANDNSNEGIYHKTKPYFSVQFHPEGNAGPLDTEFLFECFVKNNMHETMDKIRNSHCIGDPNNINTNKFRKRVVILGSGGLCIGQSGEFDYSGSQAIKAYKEEGLTTILINPNIATVQTSPGFADKVYYLPVDYENVVKVIEYERPDCIALSFGGQTALNTGIELWKSGILNKYNIEILGTPIESIINTEDREKFNNKLNMIGESVPQGEIALNLQDAINSAEKIGYPVLVRAAFALGGLGSGFANNKDELVPLVKVAFSYSTQVIIDKSLRGWKEVEYEIVRDSYDNCISVCNMENIDPLGVHTGESIVVAPSQTLNNTEYNMLRSVGIKVVRMLGIVGECNIQYALDPNSNKYYIIEVNARLSRSSALASKATGYPLAYVAAKLSLGYSLLDIKNSITKETTSCFEPSLDYCVVKIPRWDLRKFPLVSTKIDSSMKSIGESMAISRCFEEAFQKALRMSNDNIDGFEPNIENYTEENLKNPDYYRIFSLATAIYDDKYTIDELYELTRIDKWFLNKFKNIIDAKKSLEQLLQKSNKLDVNLLHYCKKIGFSDNQIAKSIHSTELIVRGLRDKYKLYPCVKQIDTVAGEFPCYTNYLYMTYNGNVNDIQFDIESVMVLGSGVYKIGSSVEFDWCTVNCIRKLRELGYKTVVVNCNPETVSTDYDEADRLYFDEISFENVMDIYKMERINGVVLAMGGQLPNNIAMKLFRHNVNVIGTSPEMIDKAENRYKFSRLLDNIGVDQPKWKELTSIEEAKEFCKLVSYPCLVRPSYVLSGAAMNIAYGDKDLEEYLENATAVSKDYPVVISKFISDAKEIEVDAVSDKGKIKLMAISEHVENAGVHSGDASLILPAQDLTNETINKIKKSVSKISKSLNINGPFNIQFIAKDDKVKVIECNLRVSRSFPFVSKTLGINFAQEATKIMLGLSYYDVNNNINNCMNKNKKTIGVKVAQFSFNRLKSADIGLGVEMLSTGEVACFGENKYEAFLKAIIASGFKIPINKQLSNKLQNGILISIGSYKFKKEFKYYASLLEKLGYKIYGTFGTTDFYHEKGVMIEQIPLFSSNEDNNKTIVNYLNNGKIKLVINISKKNKIRCIKNSKTDGYKIRRSAIDNGVPIITDIKFAKLFVNSLQYYYECCNKNLPIKSVDCLTSYKTVRLPGLIDVHVHIREPGSTYKEDWTSGSKSALAGGVTGICVMPNTNPPVIDSESFDKIDTIANSKSCCDYAIFVGANSNNSKYISKVENSVALKMYLNNTYGPLLLDSTIDWMEHIKNWNYDKPLCVHAEGKTLAGILHICNIYGKKIHVCHVAKKEEIELIKESRKNGMNITCEVSPHHLFFTTGNNNIRKGCCGVKPELQSEIDRQSLWENIDHIDCFATDHAPHTIEDKHQGCPGFPGLETALPLLLQAVKDGKLTLEQVIEKYHTNPKKIFGLPDQPNTYIEVDMDKEWIIPDKMKYTKCGWTPFAGMKVTGMVKKVVLRGKTVYIDGEIVTKPGYGINMVANKSNSSNVINVNINKLESLESINKLDSVESVKSLEPVKSVKFMKNIVSVDQFDRDMLRAIFNRASKMKELVKEYGKLDVLKDKILGSIFYEPSTRTRCSFTTAMKRLGGDVVEISSSNSSVKKGESIEDFIRCIECYTDVIVLRSSNKDCMEKILNVSKKPFINGGNGIGEHPTQALLDSYTIREERGSINGATITMIGDLKNGRTVHSLAKLLSIYNIRLRYVSPKGLEMPNDIIEYVNQKGIEQTVHDNLEDIISTTDVLYVTRLQKERLSENEKYEAYTITPKILTNAKKNLIILHPLPRTNEIPEELDNDPRTAYFRQMENGMYIRMALLAMIFNR